MAKLVGVNDKGQRIGEGHPRAKLTDHDVDLIMDLHECGCTYSEIAEKFDVAKSTIHNIVTYKSRSQTPVRYKAVQLPGPTSV